MSATIYTTSKGITIYADVGYDISSATGLELHFSAPSGGTSFVNSVSTSALGANVTTSTGYVVSANKAIKWVTNSGDFSAGAGTWKCWAEVDFGTATRLVSNSFKFKVQAPGT